ncbi:MAG: sensor histidine kinase [Bacteroidota bacterium]
MKKPIEIKKNQKFSNVPKNTSIQKERAALILGDQKENVSLSERVLSHKNIEGETHFRSFNLDKNESRENLNELRKSAYAGSGDSKEVSSRLERLIPDFIHEVSSPVNVLDHSMNNLNSDFTKFTEHIVFLSRAVHLNPDYLNFIFSMETRPVIIGNHLEERRKRKDISNWLNGFNFKKHQQGADILSSSGLDSDNPFLFDMFSSEYGEKYFDLLLSVLYMKQSLLVMESAKNRATGLIKSLKNYKDISPDEQPLNFLLEDSINEAVTILGHRLRARRFTLDINGKFTLFGIPQYLTHVLINLLANAIEATDEKGKIELKVFCIKNEVNISVTDNGIGISDQHIERIFNPYYTTKGDKGGTGIGLSLCKKYLEQMDAVLSVQSSAGSTVFNIKFKLV